MAATFGIITTLISIALLASQALADVQPLPAQPKSERSGFSPYDLERARFALGGVGGSGLALLLPVLLVIGLFIVAIPILSLVFMGGLTGFGVGVPGGLYPAGKKRSGPDPIFNQENIIKMVSFVDKALQDVGKQLNTKQS